MAFHMASMTRLSSHPGCHAANRSDNLSTVVFELDPEGKLRFLNRAWTRLTGYPIAESLGRPLDSFLPAEDAGGGSYFQDWIHRLRGGKILEGQCELRLINNQGQFIWVGCKLDAIPSDSNGYAIFGCLDDISDRKVVQEQLEYLAVHDHLTGLFNRHYFDGTLRQLAASSARGKGDHALLYIDLDHFKVVNDTFGHHLGDAVLCEISELISSRIRKSDVVCRIGGDEFAVLVTNAEMTQAQLVAEQVCELVKAFQSKLCGQQISLSCSIGISPINCTAASPEDYLKQADMALYVAKRRGRNRIQIYDPEDKENDELRSSLDWVRRLRLAIDENRVLLHFQPVINIASGEIAFFEALVRLDIPERGIVMPGEFIPFLELAGEMPMLDHEVIRRIIAHLKEYPGLNRVAVNLSAQAFRDERLVPLVEEQLLTVGVDPGRIIFELTESASMSDVKATQRMIKRLNDLGCEFAVDDFGTGFSTFGFLKQFPADYVKIDGSFIAHLDKNPIDQVLVRSITEVARALGKKTVAEFIENEAVLNLVREIGIDFAQGYYIARPSPIEKLDLSAGTAAIANL
jgi:diguanylate cyclase (GGDEF)-like protein/PAS domain S-box-containing protein